MGRSHSTRRDPPEHRLLQHWGPHRKKTTKLDGACCPHVWESLIAKAVPQRADLRPSFPPATKHPETVLYFCLEFESLASCCSTRLLATTLFCHLKLDGRTDARQLQRQSRHLHQAGARCPSSSRHRCHLPGLQSSLCARLWDCAVTCGYTTVRESCRGSSSSTSTDHHNQRLVYAQRRRLQPLKL